MYDGNIQSVLRCAQCNKPFDKPATLKRHGYYCRSRKNGGTVRSRSCHSCAKAKARCNNGRPECSRCTAKGIACHYPMKTSKATRQNTQQREEMPTQQSAVDSNFVQSTPSVETRHETSMNDDMILDGSLVPSDADFASLGAGLFDWNDANINSFDFMSLQTSDETNSNFGSFSSPPVHRSTPPADRISQVQQVLSSINVSIPAQPTQSLRTLIKRPKMKPGTQRIANLLLHTLKSFPLMLLRHNTLPPFVHPSLIASNTRDNETEALSNCMSLVHMISSGMHGSRKLFWKNVRLECERIFEEYVGFNEWQLLAAMQALSIYLLIRLDEGETDDNNIDFLLVATVVIIAKQLSGSSKVCKKQYMPYKVGSEPSWREWVFNESRQRLAVVYRVVNMLVYFEPAAMCDLQTDLLIAPLPARKQLWEAGSEFAWKVESGRDAGRSDSFALAADGELVQLSEDQRYCNNGLLEYRSLDTKNGITNWEEWCSGMDGLGGLVMLAASLVG